MYPSAGWKRSALRSIHPAWDWRSSWESSIFAIWSGVSNANSNAATEGLFCHGYLSKLLKHLFLFFLWKIVVSGWEMICLCWLTANKTLIVYLLKNLRWNRARKLKKEENKKLSCWKAVTFSNTQTKYVFVRAGYVLPLENKHQWQLKYVYLFRRENQNFSESWLPFWYHRIAPAGAFVLNSRSFPEEETGIARLELSR